MSFGNLTITPHSRVFGQSSSSSSSTVQITKDLTNSYSISSGSSKIGTFDTKYTILGNIDTIKKEQKLIISTITSDFNNSPIIGYIKTSMASTQKQQMQQQQQQQQQPTLPNPFADKTSIKQKIATEITSALFTSKNSNTAKTFIQCDFGMSILQWNCKSLGLVG
ncbi:MAG: hypothetical protein ABJB73_09300 [Candidatus Nitrosocosmicus sp.]